MSVDEYIEGAEAVEQRQEGDAGSDLPNHVTDLAPDLLLVLHPLLHHGLRAVLRLYSLVLDLELPPQSGDVIISVTKDRFRGQVSPEQ